MERTVLVVDDSVSMRQMLSLTLKGAGYQVLEGGNGQEGLDRLASAPNGRVDLIISDINMPIMDGLTFTRRLRLMSSAKFTPILILTTECSDERKAAGKAAGATGWIVKPFQPAQLLNVINKVLL